jgi:putative tryptophan/tyrosine transport system substrate-binding protein
MTHVAVALFSLALLIAPPGVGAQPAEKVYRLGFLQTIPNTRAVNYTEAFQQGLRDHGYIEGRNIIIDHRISSAPAENAAFLAELVGRKVDVIVTWTTPALVAARKATNTIPIVGISGDPVQTGLVASLARPGGNLTGLAILTDELELKNLQLLKEVVPGITRVAVLWNPDNPLWTPTVQRLQEAAPALNVKLQPLAVRNLGELQAAFAAATRQKASALLVLREGIFAVHRQHIVNFAAAQNVPPDVLRAQLGTGASHVAQILPEVHELVPGLLAPPAVNPDAARFCLFAAVTGFLRNVATAQPSVAILDDLHAADTPSLLLLQFLAIPSFRRPECSTDPPRSQCRQRKNRRRQSGRAQSTKRSESSMLRGRTARGWTRAKNYARYEAWDGLNFVR